jgi:hypothetical protein
MTSWSSLRDLAPITRGQRRAEKSLSNSGEWRGSIRAKPLSLACSQKSVTNLRCETGAAKWRPRPSQLRPRLGSTRPRRRSLPASACRPRHSVLRKSCFNMGTLTYPTPMDSLSGNHDRILNLEPWRLAAPRQPHDRPSVTGVAGVAGAVVIPSQKAG